MKKPTNEPILDYKPGSNEREQLEKALKELSENPVDVPLVIGKERITRKLDQKQLIVRTFLIIIIIIYILIVAFG